MNPIFLVCKFTNRGGMNKELVQNNLTIVYNAPYSCGMSSPVAGLASPGVGLANFQSPSSGVQAYDWEVTLKML